jgi:hypothetical protein
MDVIYRQLVRPGSSNLKGDGLSLLLESAAISMDWEALRVALDLEQFLDDVLNCLKVRRGAWDDAVAGVFALRDAYERAEIKKRVAS